MSQFKQQRRPSNACKANPQSNQEPTTNKHTRILRRSLNHSPDEREAGTNQHAHPSTERVGCRGSNKGTDKTAHEDNGSHKSKSGVTGVIHIYSEYHQIRRERKEERGG
jgi:hypothetical protein